MRNLQEVKLQIHLTRISDSWSINPQTNFPRLKSRTLVSLVVRILLTNQFHHPWVRISAANHAKLQRRTKNAGEGSLEMSLIVRRSIISISGKDMWFMTLRSREMMRLKYSGCSSFSSCSKISKILVKNSNLSSLVIIR